MDKRRRIDSPGGWLPVLVMILLFGCGRENAQSEETSDAQTDGSAIAVDAATTGDTNPSDPSELESSVSVADAPDQDLTANEKGSQVSVHAEPVAEEVTTSKKAPMSPDEFPKVPRPALPPAQTRQAAPEIVMKDMRGNPIALTDLKGEVVLVAFWATWCPPCKAEIPHLVHLQSTYGETGFRVLGVSLDQRGLAVVKPFVRGRKEINYTIIPYGIQAQQAFGGVQRIPTNFLIDKQGRIIQKFRGLTDPKELEGYVQAALIE